MTNTIIMKSLRLKIHKKTLKNRVTRKCDTFYRNGQTDIYLWRKPELAEAAACVKGTSSICVASVGAEMYLAQLCICSKILRFRERNSWNSGHIYLRKWCFTRPIDFTVDISSRFLSSVHKAFTSENILSPKWCFTRPIDFTVDTSSRFFSSIH
jgi:hypothetical protein